jgi:predicted dinucleotide-binding enzyme
MADGGPLAAAGTSRQAAEASSVLLFAVPYDALPDLGRDLRDAMAGKIVLDACNPNRRGENALTQEALANGIGVTSQKYLAGTRLVRAFNSVDATAIAASAGRQTRKLGVPLAVDDAAAVAMAERLVRDAGCEPVVVGGLATANQFQHGTPLYRANSSTAQDVRRLLGMSDAG